MTTLIIDYKAKASRPFRYYLIDRNEYPEIEDLKRLANDCLNPSVYLIKVIENEKELFTIRNEK